MAVRGWARSVFVAVLVAAGNAQAGNDDELFVGNQAAMLGGAVLATVSDSSALWYNPAGLGAVERDQVDISATVYTLRVYQVPDFLAARGGRSEDGSVAEFVVAPSQLAYVRRFAPGISGGIGYFVPRSSNYVLRESLDSGNRSERSEWQVAAAIEEIQHIGAAGVGIAVSERLRLGASLIGGYAGTEQSITLFGAVHRPEQPDAVNTRTVIGTNGRLSLELGLGMQLELSDAFVLGVALRSPQLQVYNGTNATLNGAVASLPEAAAMKERDVSQQGLEVLRLGRAAASLSFFYPRGWLTAELDVQPGFQNAAASVDRKLLVNGRLGWYHSLTRAVALGLGLFTDRHAETKHWALLAGSGDFYGMTVGFELSNEHLLAASERATTLIFNSVIALRYAFCSGQFGRIEADPARIADMPFIAKKGELTVNEIGVYLGSGLRF